MDSRELKSRCTGQPGASQEFPFGDEVSVFKVGGKMFAPAGLSGAGGITCILSGHRKG